MSFWDILNFNKIGEEKISRTIANGKIPTTGSQKELELYLKYKIGDAEFAKIIMQALEKTGPDGTIEIKQGGDGNPYKLEYISSKLHKTMSKKEIKKRINEIKARLDNNDSLSEKEISELQSELSQLAGHHIIIWTNSANQEEFATKEKLFSKAVVALQEMFNK